MTLYPDVQRKAQAALDAVVGRSRLPDFGDSDALPYIHAIVKEALRWNVVAPLGLPHRTLRDEVFRGCFVPAGTTVLTNAWCVRLSVVSSRRSSRRVRIGRYCTTPLRTKTRMSSVRSAFCATATDDSTRPPPPSGQTRLRSGSAGGTLPPLPLPKNILSSADRAQCMR